MTQRLLSTLVLTIIGPDRPGLVETLAAPVAWHSGNWLESRMAHLAGEFAGILRVAVPATSEADLIADLKGLKSQGLQVTVQKNGVQELEATAPVQNVRFRLIGQDRPGIVATVSRVLASSGANVEELVTDCKCAPMTGEMLFEADAIVSVPETTSVEQLCADLERIASDLMVDVTFDV